MKSLLAIVGMTTIILGACAHEGYPRRECGDCHDRCDHEEHACGDRHEADCGGRRHSCDESCRMNEMCR